MNHGATLDSCLCTSSFNLLHTSSGPLILKEKLFGLLRDIGLVLCAVISATDRQTKIGSALFKSPVIHLDKGLCSLQKDIFVLCKCQNK